MPPGISFRFVDPFTLRSRINSSSPSLMFSAPLPLSFGRCTSASHLLHSFPPLQWGSPVFLPFASVSRSVPLVPRRPVLPLPQKRTLAGLLHRYEHCFFPPLSLLVHPDHQPKPELCSYFSQGYAWQAAPFKFSPDFAFASSLYPIENNMFPLPVVM